MKVFITTYKRNNGLVLSNNYVKNLPDYDLKEFLMEYFDNLDELNYTEKTTKIQLNKNGYSNIVETEKDSIIYHIRFSS